MSLACFFFQIPSVENRRGTGKCEVEIGRNNQIVLRPGNQIPLVSDTHVRKYFFLYHFIVVNSEDFIFELILHVIKFATFYLYDPFVFSPIFVSGVVNISSLFDTFRNLDAVIHLFYVTSF